MEEGKTNQTGAHHHHTAQGVFGPTPVANTGTCQPARTIDAPVVREGIIPPTVGAEGAPTSCIRVRRSRTRQQTRERGGAPRRRVAEGCRRRRIEKKTSQGQRQQSRQNRWMRRCMSRGTQGILPVTCPRGRTGGSRWFTETGYTPEMDHTTMREFTTTNYCRKGGRQ